MAKKSSAQAREKMDEYVPSEAREHMKAAREAMRESVRALFPPEFIDQRRADVRAQHAAPVRAIKSHL